MKASKSPLFWRKKPRIQSTLFCLPFWPPPSLQLGIPCQDTTHAAPVMFLTPASPIQSIRTFAWGSAPPGQWAPSWLAYSWRHQPWDDATCVGPGGHEASWSDLPWICLQTPPGSLPGCCRKEIERWHCLHLGCLFNTDGCTPHAQAAKNGGETS